VFEMHEDGLAEVGNPSEIFLSERPLHGAGSVVTSTVEGSRPILVEVQALVAPSYFSAPRRMCTGVDFNRTMMLLAVLEKRVGISLGGQDVYVNLAGGVKIGEPAIDLAVQWPWPRTSRAARGGADRRAGRGRARRRGACREPHGVPPPRGRANGVRAGYRAGGKRAPFAQGARIEMVGADTLRTAMDRALVEVSR